MKAPKSLTALTMPFGILGLAAALALGCDNKETILDVEGPGGRGVEIERDRNTGAVEVDVDRKDEKVIDINTPGGGVEVTRDRNGIDVNVDNK